MQELICTVLNQKIRLKSQITNYKFRTELVNRDEKLVASLSSKVWPLKKENVREMWHVS